MQKWQQNLKNQTLWRWDRYSRLKERQANSNHNADGPPPPPLTPTPTPLTPTPAESWIYLTQ